MRIIIVRAMWGMTGSDTEEKLRRIAGAGFDAVEMGAPEDADERRELKRLLREQGLELVVQQWTRGEDVAGHIASFEEQYRRALDLEPLFVNSHSGRDHFGHEANVEILGRALELAAEHGLPAVHETHRSRATFSAPATVALLDALPKLRLCCDFSHWCCVHESFLDDQSVAVGRAITAAGYVHARVGHTQAPQIPDPRVPEWQRAVDKHLAWWDRIVERSRTEGREHLAICPEFGPYPYMVQQPFTRQDIADLWEVNCWMKDQLRERYGS